MLSEDVSHSKSGKQDTCHLKGERVLYSKLVRNSRKNSQNDKVKRDNCEVIKCKKLLPLLGLEKKFEGADVEPRVLISFTRVKNFKEKLF